LGVVGKALSVEGILEMLERERVVEDVGWTEQSVRSRPGEERDHTISDGTLVLLLRCWSSNDEGR
jgi:hypothetical protein